VRYALSPYIKQIGFVFKGLNFYRRKNEKPGARSKQNLVTGPHLLQINLVKGM
jgi:hypothetical protein